MMALYENRKEILLVNPSYNKVYKGGKTAAMQQPHLGLAYIAGFLEQNNIKVKILDANMLGLSVESAANSIIRFPGEVVGITAYTSTIKDVYAIAVKVKEFSNKKIIVGGPHVTFLPVEVLNECPQIDIVVCGEGEWTLFEIIKGKKELRDINGIAFRSECGKIVVNPERKLIKNLDKLPFPARHLFPLNLCRSGVLFNISKDKYFATIITSRGCLGRCSFCCSHNFWKKVRYRSLENVIDEIEQLVENYNVKQIGILDDSFLSNKTRAEKFCDMLIKKSLKLSWWCYARPDSRFDERFLRKLKKAGCYGFYVGVESGCQTVLLNTGKKVNLSTVHKFIKVLKENDFLVVTSFIIGLAGENIKKAMQTINFAIKLNPHIAQFCIAAPFPGTAFYKESIEKGWINRNNTKWDEMNMHDRSSAMNEFMSSDEIFGMYKMALKKFYLRPYYIITLLIRLIKYPREIKGFLLGGKYLVCESMAWRKN